TSRRRHTRWVSDWSSDVCSSDLGEQAYAARDFSRAKQLYLRVMQETDKKPLHATAYYGLARIAVLEKDPETGDRLFRKVLELERSEERRVGKEWRCGWGSLPERK